MQPDLQPMTPPSTLDAALDLLARLVAFDTESAKSNLALIDAVADHCRSLGVEVSLAPNRDGTKAALVATVGPLVDGGLVLSGHTDVVPVAGQAWTSDPFTLRRDGGRLYGRGTADMKGFGALALAMLPEIRAAELPVPVHVVLSYDEEVTCLGSVDIIERFGRDLPRPSAVIVGEPTRLEVADSHKSVCTYRTVVEGREAHSAKPALGAHAIAAGCEIACELNRLGLAFEREPDGSGRFDPPFATVQVGVIGGGTASNILARHCELVWQFRGLPGMPLDTAERQVARFVETTALPLLNRYGHPGTIATTVEVEVPGLSPEPGSVAERLAGRAARRNGTVSASFATEAGRFQAAGLSTVVCGPGSIDQAHQPDEYIEVSQMEAGLAFLRGLVEGLR